MDDIRSALTDLRRSKPELPAIEYRRRIRESARITQEELAVVVGVSRVAVSRWEDGTRTPWGENQRRYAKALQEMAL